ncbi:nuclear transport factor 2 family protein [Rhodococcus fascians]|nr:nuclear transport factor 2 family protein [Rhodococcus fascians]MBY3999959.1 nuclear transport factor 2 family protein [Rhodococcus fascians]MBY4005142.1 nuclear transport factor 2 family protein [Rhodococcus fascians]MBY4010299.1 nuclear transport factor 2 family protein [Rhodococcus fascians]MBY4020342.1 nuclear transport factor 2 family protein [Rhodococcus fascians]
MTSELTPDPLEDAGSLAAAIRDLLAEREIRRVIQIYCHAVDRRDLALLQTIYHEGAVENHVHYEGDALEFGPYIFPSLTDRGFRLGNHHVTGILVDIDGDTAKAESYFYSAARRFVDPENEDGDSELSVLSGRYLDKFENRGGSWRIVDRKVVIDLDFKMPYVSLYEDGKVLIRGSMQGDDVASGWFSR